MWCLAATESCSRDRMPCLLAAVRTDLAFPLTTPPYVVSRTCSIASVLLVLNLVSLTSPIVGLMCLKNHVLTAHLLPLSIPRLLCAITLPPMSNHSLTQTTAQHSLSASLTMYACVLCLFSFRFDFLLHVLCRTHMHHYYHARVQPSLPPRSGAQCRTSSRMMPASWHCPASIA